MQRELLALLYISWQQNESARALAFTMPRLLRAIRVVIACAALISSPNGFPWFPGPSLVNAEVVSLTDSTIDDALVSIVSATPSHFSHHMRRDLLHHNLEYLTNGSPRSAGTSESPLLMEFIHIRPCGHVSVFLDVGFCTKHSFNGHRPYAPPPPFPLPFLQHSLGDMLILFKAKQCPHCKRMAPDFEKLSDDEDLKRAGIAVTSIDVPTNRASTIRFSIRYAFILVEVNLIIEWHGHLAMPFALKAFSFRRLFLVWYTYAEQGFPYTHLPSQRQVVPIPSQACLHRNESLCHEGI